VRLDLNEYDLMEAGERRRQIALAVVGAVVLVGVGVLAYMSAQRPDRPPPVRPKALVTAPEPPRDIRVARRLAQPDPFAASSSAATTDEPSRQEPSTGSGSGVVPSGAGVELVEAAKRAAAEARAGESDR
jgi:hypothetical protein